MTGAFWRLLHFAAVFFAFKYGSRGMVNKIKAASTQLK